MILLILQNMDRTKARGVTCPNCGSHALAASVSDRKWLDAVLLLASVVSYQCRVCNEHFRSPGSFEVRVAANGLSVRACCE